MSVRSATSSLTVIRSYPFDLAVITLAALLGAILLTTTEVARPIRLAGAVVVAFVLPGYALVSVLFPARHTLDVAERLGLSVAVSIAIVPIVALGLPATPWGLGTEPLAFTLGGGTILLAQLGVWRRLKTPASDRFVVSPHRSLKRLGRGEFQLSSAVLLLAVGAAGGVLALGLFTPATAGGFSELGLYTETDDGDLVAGEIPDEVGPDESVPMTVTIENHERTHTEYTVVVQEQRLEDGEVHERTTLAEWTEGVADGETATTSDEFEPTAEAGETVRIAVLLFTDEPPTEPTIAEADLDTHSWVAITDE